VIIRPMSMQDRPAVMHILKNTPEFNALDLATAEEVLDSYLHDPVNSGYHTLVIEEDSRVAGYVSYGKNPMTQTTWDIYWIAVDRGSQGRGFGRELLTTAEKNIQTNGGKLIIIETSSTPLYERTNRFYHLMGYKLDCRIADYYAPGDDLFIYEKRFK
jgi:ribosomal protein S18 acetylase RimI-like enzyme